MANDGSEKDNVTAQPTQSVDLMEHDSCHRSEANP